MQLDVFGEKGDELVAHVTNHLLQFTKKVPTIDYFLIKYSSAVDDTKLRQDFKNILTGTKPVLVLAFS